MSLRWYRSSRFLILCADISVIEAARAIEAEPGRRSGGSRSKGGSPGLLPIAICSCA
jgi:hypothetical protein